MLLSQGLSQQVQSWPLVFGSWYWTPPLSASISANATIVTEAAKIVWDTTANPIADSEDKIIANSTSPSPRT